MDKASLSRLTVVQLKSKLRENKLKVSGRKSELIDRLLDFNENNNNTLLYNTNQMKKPRKQVAKKKVNSPIKSPIKSSNNIHNFGNNFSFNNDNIISTINEDKTILQDISHSNFIVSNNNPKSIERDENVSYNFNFISPIIGTKDNDKSLRDLYNNGFISKQEYEQRKSILDSSTEFYSSSLSSKLKDLSISDSCTEISISQYKDWCLAIKEDNISELNSILIPIISILSKINENELSHFEKYERVCKMLKKIRLRHFNASLSSKYLNNIYDKLTTILKTFSHEEYLVQTLNVYSKLAWASKTPKNILLTKNIDRILDLGEYQIKDNVYSSVFTISLVETLRYFLRSFNYNTLNNIQKKRIVDLLFYYTTHSDHKSILEHSMIALSIPCYFSDELENIVNQQKYFMESIFAHLSNTSPLVCYAATAIFINICSGPDHFLDQTIQLGVLDKLISLLKQYFYNDREDSKTLIKEIYFCLSNYAGGTKNQVESCLDRGLLKILISQYPEASSLIQREMIWCLSNFFLSGASPSYFNDINIFILSNDILQDVNIQDEDAEQFRKGLLTAKKKILPVLNFDHPEIDNLIENLSE